jgi:hypothetical protein
MQLHPRLSWFRAFGPPKDSRAAGKALNETLFRKGLERRHCCPKPIPGKLVSRGLKRTRESLNWILEMRLSIWIQVLSDRLGLWRKRQRRKIRTARAKPQDIPDGPWAL